MRAPRARRRKKAPLKDRIQYTFDNLMSRGGTSILWGLLLLIGLSFVLMVLLRLAVAAVLPDDTVGGLPEILWRALTQIIDAGAVEADADAHLTNKIVGLVGVSVGLVFFSALIAFISNQFERKVDELRKGKSAVIERGHTLILGFGIHVVQIIEQLVIANESERGAPAVVVVSKQDKAEMDDFLNEQIPDRKNTRVITRSGDVSNPNFIRKMSVTEARSIIVLNNAKVVDSPEVRDKGDARVLEATIAVVAAVGEENLPPVVAQLHSDRTTRLAQNLVPGKITIIDTNDILARILVYTSLNPGLAFVYDNLVGFKGHEIYMHRPRGGWLSHPFGKLQFHFINSVLLGFRTPEGEILLNPHPDFVPHDDYDGVILAEDDSLIRFYQKQVVTPREQQFFTKKPRIVIERQLIVGWNSKISRIIAEYALSMRDASAIDVLVGEASAAVRSHLEAVQDAHGNIRIRLLLGDVHDPGFLRKLRPQDYDNVVILAEESASVEDVDLHTLSRLLEFRQAFRDVEQQTDQRVKANLVTEVIDSDKADLFFKAGAQDFLIPHKFVSEIIAQIAQEPDLKRIYDDIFDEEGCEIYVKPVDLYFQRIPTTASFADCMRAAQMRGEVCMGVKISSEAANPKKNLGLYLPPDKNLVFQLLEDDCLVTLAPDRN
ncbi:hypothetical protein ACFL59_04310 [Planctomycetota bacterium]